jgi:hypothetical protein
VVLDPATSRASRQRIVGCGDRDTNVYCGRRAGTTRTRPRRRGRGAPRRERVSPRRQMAGHIALVCHNSAPPNQPMGPERSINASTTQARRCTRVAPKGIANDSRPPRGASGARGGRAVECTGLENRRARFSGVGSRSAASRRGGTPRTARSPDRQRGRRLSAAHVARGLAQYGRPIGPPGTGRRGAGG